MISPIQEVILRTFLALGVVLILARVMGRRSVAQLTLYDYVIGLVFGNVGATFAVDRSIPVVTLRNVLERPWEGLDNAPAQKAFVENWGFQCGYCTSGFIMVCHALATLKPDAGDFTIEQWLQSNICRCTSYDEIRYAVSAIVKTK